MRMNNPSRVCLICLLLSLVSSWVQAAPRSMVDWGPVPSLGGGWPANPPTPFWAGNRSGMGPMPTSFPRHIQRGFSPGWAGAQTPTSQASAPPRLEVEVSESTLYVNQTIVYTVRAVSSSNLKTVNMTLPVSEGIVLRKVDGPLTSVRHRGGRPEIINEYRFALTPLKDGDLSIAPVRVTGTQALDNQWNQTSSESRRFDVTSQAPVSLQVKRAEPSVQPWLPLRDLQIDGALERPRIMGAGKPLKLSVQLTAVGTDGDRLPSVEPQLKAPGFRIYREDRQTSRSISADGQALLGRRTETYTLVPLEGETPELPIVRVAWWNVGSGALEEAALSIDKLYAADGASSGASRKASLPSKDSFPILAIPFLIIFVATIAYWLGLWSRNTAFGGGILALPGRGLQATHRWTTRHSRRLLLSTAVTAGVLWKHLRHRLITVMPMQVKLWFCVRYVAQQDNPLEWYRLFRPLICKPLKISEHSSLQRIADRIIEVHPRPKPERLHELVRALDGAIYGGEPLDFSAWKTSLEQQLSPTISGRKRRGGGAPHASLPALNPEVA